MFTLTSAGRNATRHLPLFSWRGVMTFIGFKFTLKLWTFSVITVFSGVFSASMASAEGPRQKEVVDEAVAVVEGRLLTLSELEFEARITLLMAGGAPPFDVSLDAQTLKEALEYAIAVRLQNAEAEKLQVYPVEEKELMASFSQLRSRFSSEADYLKFLSRFDFDEVHLLAVLNRNLRAAHVLEARIRLRAQVSDRDVRLYYEAHLEDFEKVSFENIREVLKARLLAKKLKELAALEIKRVRKAGDVRILAAWARTPSGAP